MHRKFYHKEHLMKGSTSAATTLETEKPPLSRGRFGDVDDRLDFSRTAECHRVNVLSQQLRSVLSPICREAYFIQQALTVQPAMGKREPVTRVDCVAVTQFGVFVVDSVDWIGIISPTFNDDTLSITEEGGVVSNRSCPVRRLEPAVVFLRALLEDFHCPVEGVAVFHRDDCIVNPSVPPSLLKPDELHHFFRVKLNRFINQRRHFVDIDGIGMQLMAIG
jgi:hypothetical protein